MKHEEYKYDFITDECIEEVIQVFTEAGFPNFRHNSSLKIIARKLYSSLLDLKKMQIESKSPKIIKNVNKIDPNDPITFKLMQNKGFKCPTCEQNVAFSSVSINKETAKCLLRLYNLSKNNPSKEYYHMNKDINVSVSVGGSWAKLRWWNLIEPQIFENKRVSGMWKITDFGKSFCENQVSVKEKVRLFNRTFYGFHGKKVFFKDCIGNFKIEDIFKDGEKYIF